MFHSFLFLAGSLFLAGVAHCAKDFDLPFEICAANTFAFCDQALCFVFNDLAYCNCMIVHDKSSATLVEDYTFPDGTSGDACDILAQLADSDTGAYLSTYYTDPRIEIGYTPISDTRAIYTYDKSNTAFYAQCDGGFCFRSTSGAVDFPFFGDLGDDEIICACPITNAKAPFQIEGPFPDNECDTEWSSTYCSQDPSKVKNDRQLDNGAIIAVGSPEGAPLVLGKALNPITFPGINVCPALPKKFK